jgi:lysophospholipase L1-like esterase
MGDGGEGGVFGEPDGAATDASSADVRDVNAGDADAGPMAPPGPRFIGRWDNAQASWSHSAVALRFTGTDISVTLAGASVWYEVLVDGTRSKFQGGSGTYSLATNLPAGPHDVMVIRRQESFFGIGKFVAFSAPQNAWLPSNVPSRRIEVIGDSISAGYGDEGCPFGVNENSDLAYGAVAARAVLADVHIIATSGIGMAKSLSGAKTMPEIYEHTFGDINATAWDFTRYAPDVVVINLGTNDNNAGVDKNAYKVAYTAFLGTVRGHYPNAFVYCVSQNGNTLVTELKAVVAAKADPKIKYLALSGNGLGCMGHPDVMGQQQMANGLVAVLQADLGW